MPQSTHGPASSILKLNVDLLNSAENAREGSKCSLKPNPPLLEKVMFTVLAPFIYRDGELSPSVMRPRLQRLSCLRQL